MEIKMPVITAATHDTKYNFYRKCTVCDDNKTLAVVTIKGEFCQECGGDIHLCNDHLIQMLEEIAEITQDFS